MLVPILGVTRRYLVDYINNHLSKLCKVESEYLYPHRTGQAILVNTVKQFLGGLPRPAVWMISSVPHMC